MMLDISLKSKPLQGDLLSRTISHNTNAQAEEIKHLLQNLLMLANYPIRKG